MLKLIYIAGYGRSGTTILDMLLGQQKGIFGMGELAAMSRHVWENREYCACQQRITECDFWSPVMQHWLSEKDTQNGYVALQKRMEPLYSAHRRGTALSDYLSNTYSLLSKVAAAAGVSTLVDSSKMPGRGLALARSDKIDLRVLHVVRDGRAVAHSMTRPMEVDVAKGLQKRIIARPGYRTALRWRLYNQRAERLGRIVGPKKYARIRYEDLVTDTGAQLARIAEVTGVDFSEQRPGKAITAQHQMAGSRIRMSGPLILREDTRWKDEITPSVKRAVETIARSQMRRYGYLNSDQ